MFSFKIFLNALIKILNMFKVSEILKIDKQPLIKNYSFIYFFRPISILPTYIFYKLKFTPNQITYLRIMMFFLLLIHPVLNFELKILTFFLLVLFIQILDFCDGNLSRIYDSSNLYGKLIDGLGDIIIPLSYLYLSFFTNSFNLNNYMSYLLFLTLAFYFLSLIIELKLTLYRQISKSASNTTITTTNISRFKLYLRSSYESIQSSHILLILIFVLFGYIYEVVIILCFLSFFSFIDALRSVYKIKNDFKIFEYTNLSSLNNDKN